MNYYTKETLTTSSLNIEDYSLDSRSYYKQVEWWEHLKPGDKIVYEYYYEKQGKIAIHTIVEEEEKSFLIVTQANVYLQLEKYSLDKYCTLEDFKMKYPEEFI